ncbi:MAG: hypothetical protein OXG04_02105 [Acidobacteria bacterium]|nr:hypothetical protein [Acidobacteriota bacterium]
MKARHLVLLLAGILAVSLAAPAAAQTEAPRTAWGAPDLQGIWDFRTITPMERPEELGDRAFLTEEEAANLEQATVDRNAQLLVAEARRTEAGGNVGAYNNFWMDRGTRTVSNRRTSLIVDPPNGRIPPVTADGQARKDAVAVRRGRPAFGPEDRSIGERCLLGFNAGPPMEPRAYNNHTQLFQTPDHVVILNEMVNDSRIVPLDGRDHLPEDVAQWRGDSRARWEDDTLVVETRNFHTDTAFSERQGSSPDMVLTERFTRVDDETLLYAATMDDPSTWTQPWTFEVTMFRTDEPVYEYACHEGNIGMDGILAGARADDARAAEQQ